MDDTRILRRTRAQQYDLRRKVLLKNFLREQMTQIPVTRTESFPKCENATEKSLSSDEDVPKINEQASSSAVVDDAFYGISLSSDDNNTEHKYVDEIDLTEEVDVVTIDNFEIAGNSNNKNISRSPGLVRFTGLFKRESKSTSKGTFKAKRLSKNVKSTMKTRSFKKSFEKVFYGHKKHHEKLSSSKMPKNSSRSLFDLFKRRKEQRNAKDSDRIKQSSDDQIPKNVPTKFSSTNQSVQTDNSWVKEEINKVHQSNKRLKEENKLLSESLSYFMSNASIDPQQRQCSSPFQTSNKNDNSLIFHDYSLPPSSSNQDRRNSRPKVSRSKSVHEFNERLKVLRSTYRTKSMNVHNSRNYFLTNSRPLLPDVPPRLRKSNIFTDMPNSSSSRNIQRPSMPKRRLSENDRLVTYDDQYNIFTDIPNSSSSRSVQRSSSMPKRRLRQNDKLVNYGRSNSMRNTHARKPFYALSADAFY